jgi:hypothetical protein
MQFEFQGMAEVVEFHQVTNTVAFLEQFIITLPIKHVPLL